MNDNRASRATRESLDETMVLGAETVRGVQEEFTSAVENVRDLNVKLIDMARANTIAAFDFARDVTEAKGPSDFIQAWTTHATKQFDILTKQASGVDRSRSTFRQYNGGVFAACGTSFEAGIAY